MRPHAKSRLSALFLTLAVLLTACGTDAPAELSTQARQERGPRPERLGLSSERLGRIAPVMQQDIDAGLVPGYLTLIARHGQRAHLEAQGWADIENRIPVEQDSLFRMYSMTKPITATATMILLEEGRLLLSDPVSKYIPAFSNMVVRNPDGTTVPASRQITIRDVLTNTAGVPTYGIGLTDPGIDTEMPMSQLVARLAELPLNFQPGTAYEYGFGIAVAGVIVEIVSGRTLEEFFQERIFGPLGMGDTSFFVPAEKASRLVTQYVSSGQGAAARLVRSNVYSSDKVNGSKVQFGGDGWGGGVVSSAHDYARFAHMLLNGGELDGVRIISRQSVERITASHTGSLPLAGVTPGHGWGLGLSVLQDVTLTPGIGSVGRFGWSGAAFTYFFVDPKEDLVVIRLSQLLGSAAVSRSRPEVLDSLVYGALR